MIIILKFMNLNKIIYKNFHKEKLDTIKLFSLIKLENIQNFNKLVKLSLQRIKKKNKILLYGNGGSAADAQHIATELTVRFKKNRRAIPAVSLSTDTSALTAIGNDFSFEKIFSRQIEAIGMPGDVAIAITTSGNSKNLIEAAKMAKQKKIYTFCFSGNNGGKLKRYTKFPIIIPSKITSQVQVAEIFLGQIYCGILEDSI